jgi:hypothetical protein
VKRKPRPDPVILEMRLSQVRELISRLGSAHSDLHEHRGWSNCECPLADVLRELSNAILKHLGLAPNPSPGVDPNVRAH